MCLRCAQAAAVGDGHVHAAPSVMRVLTDFARLAPASYREFGLSWQTPITDDQMQVPDVKPGGLQISLVRGRWVLTAVTWFWADKTITRVECGTCVASLYLLLVRTRLVS